MEPLPCKSPPVVQVGAGAGDPGGQVLGLLVHSCTGGATKPVMA